jgi:hypothetical protein
MMGWILLPVEFKGIWYNAEYGGFSVYVRDRFNVEYPPDRLNVALIMEAKDYDESKHPDHKFAKPTWMSKERFERKFGRVEAVVVDEDEWKGRACLLEHILIFTDKYVVTLVEYDGLESFLALPRDWRKLIDRGGMRVLQ